MEIPRCQRKRILVTLHQGSRQAEMANDIWLPRLPCVQYPDKKLPASFVLEDGAAVACVRDALRLEP